MLRLRSVWLRVLRLYEVDDQGSDGDASRFDDSLLDARVHARSRFRSLEVDRRFAVYSVHNADGTTMLPLGLPLGGRPGIRHGEHTLVAVREFRRVPLDASSLALTLFTARPGKAVAVVATLAHFVERAVDVYQPGYVLLAHSLEDPRTSLLLTAVQDSLALAAAGTAAFSLSDVLGDLDSMLAESPEFYTYYPEVASEPLSGAVSPYAV